MDESLRTEVTEPVLARFEARHFLGIRSFYPASDGLEKNVAGLTEQSERATPRLISVDGRVDDATVGLMIGMFSREDGFEYLAGVEVLPDAATDVPEGMVAVALPARRYLSFPTPIERLRETVYTIWYEWLPGSPYAAAGDATDLPDFMQRYGDGYDLETGSGTIEVQFPIRD